MLKVHLMIQNFFRLSALKNYLTLLLVCLIVSCDSENANDCFQTAGKIIETQIDVEPFTKIRTETDVKLLIKQGEQQKVVIKTGENLLNDIEIKVEDGRLIARNNNSCNLVRDYGITQIIVTTPDLQELRNGSGGEIESEGVLKFASLILQSNTNPPAPTDIKKSGNFILDLDVQTLTIRANGKSVFYLKGNTDLLDVRFDDEAPRLESQDLIADEVQVFHRGANKMIVNPQHRISGTITGTGDVIAVNHPPVVEVEEVFKGRLIFQE